MANEPIVWFQDNVLTINKSLFKVVSINTCLVEKDGGGNTGADAPVSVFKPPPVTNVIEIFTLVGFNFLQ